MQHKVQDRETLNLQTHNKHPSLAAILDLTSRKAVTTKASHAGAVHYMRTLIYALRRVRERGFHL
jgi:hypothetical protein